MRLVPVLCAALISGSVASAQTGPSVAEGPGVWRLIGIDGVAPAHVITLAFTDDGRIAGQAPCNLYFAAASIADGSITVSDIGATRRACDGLDEEGRFLHALSRVTRIERQGVRMTLSGDGVQLDFATPMN